MVIVLRRCDEPYTAPIDPKSVCHYRMSAFVHSFRREYLSIESEERQRVSSVDRGGIRSAATRTKRLLRGLAEEE